MRASIVATSIWLVRKQADETRTRFAAFKGDLGEEPKRFAQRRNRGD